jgi:hypothetical protein
LPLEGASFLVWALEKSGAATDVRFQVIDADRLAPLEPALVPPSFVQITAPGKETKVTASLAEGQHGVVLPPGLESLPELLMWVQSDEPTDVLLKLWSVNPTARKVSVFRQTWFDSSKYDLGYQWPTRVSRDPSSGRVIGEGIRMGVFSLSESCNDIDEWLIQDSFYGPRG